QNGRVPGKAKLEIHVRFIKVAESMMTTAARELKAFPKAAERVQGIAVSATEKLKVCAIVAGLCREFIELKLITEHPALFVKLIRLLQLIDVTEKIRQIQGRSRNAFRITQRFEDFTCFRICFSRSLIIIKPGVDDTNTDEQSSSSVFIAILFEPYFRRGSGFECFSILCGIRQNTYVSDPHTCCESVFIPVFELLDGPSVIYDRFLVLLVRIERYGEHSPCFQ